MTLNARIDCEENSWHASFHSNAKLQADAVALKWHLEPEVCPRFRMSPPLMSKYFNPLAYSLVRVEWKVFGVLTFTANAFTYQTDKSETLRQDEFESLLSGTSAKHGLRPRNLTYYGFGINLEMFFVGWIQIENFEVAGEVEPADEIGGFDDGLAFADGTMERVETVERLAIHSSNFSCFNSGHNP
jgi:hypothetical protein